MKFTRHVHCFFYTVLFFIPFFSMNTEYKFCFVSQEKKSLRYKQISPKLLEENELWITLWVHGTRCFTKPFFKNFFDVPQGLNKAVALPENTHSNYLAKTICAENHSLFSLDHFYMFGWSGALSAKARQEASKALMYEVQTLINAYQEKKLFPKIRIITHSHGGNVALYLAEQELSFCIDELILLACPVQEQTKNYISNPLFKQIISLYSPWDLLQVADPQGLSLKELHIHSPLFSKRTFPLQPNLFQVELWYNNRGPMHIEFLLCDSLSCIARLLPTILTHTKNHFVTQFSCDTPKPIQKLLITD